MPVFCQQNPYRLSQFWSAQKKNVLPTKTSFIIFFVFPVLKCYNYLKMLDVENQFWATAPKHNLICNAKYASKRVLKGWPIPTCNTKYAKTFFMRTSELGHPVYVIVPFCVSFLCSPFRNDITSDSLKLTFRFRCTPRYNIQFSYFRFEITLKWLSFSHS